MLCVDLFRIIDQRFKSEKLRRAAIYIGCDSSLATGLSESPEEQDLGQGLVGVLRFTQIISFVSFFLPWMQSLWRCGPIDVAHIKRTSFGAVWWDRRGGLWHRGLEQVEQDPERIHKPLKFEDFKIFLNRSGCSLGFISGWADQRLDSVIFHWRCPKGPQQVSD